jgi:acyl-CoA synthetase (AMP-forming)/AMP-acid ligase II
MHPIDFFWRAAARVPDRTAVISPAGRLSYAELAAIVRARAAAVLATTAAGNPYVCVGGADGLDHLVAILAVLAAGKVWVPLNPRNGDPELRRIIGFLEPGLVLADESLAARLADCGAPLRPLDVTASGAPPLPPAPMPARALGETQAVKFTGGTTGIPKGVQQPLRAWNTNIVTQLHELMLTGADRYLVAAPLTHGTSTYILPTLATGGALVFPDAGGADGLLDAIHAHAASVLFGPPTLIQALADAQLRQPRALPSLRLLLYGGAPMRLDQIAAAHTAFGPVLGATFGQTEAPQIATFLAPAEMAGDRLLSTGRPTLLTDVAVLDVEGRPLPVGEQGEIALRGDLVMTGYLGAPDDTAKVLVDGWLRTGDVGLFDAGGYLFIRDRLRDVIITGGFNVYPGDVEAVLGAHPAIADCSVVGVADAKWGEAVHGAVQLRPGAPFDPAQVTRSVRDALGPVKTPKQLHVFAALPKSAVGKIQKTAIRAEIEARLRAPAPSA